MHEELRPATRLVVGGRPAPEPGAPLNPPVSFASTFHAGAAVGYGRDGNPTWSAFEELLGELEGGEAVVFGSGLAASSAVLALVPDDGVVVAPAAAYHGVLEQLDELAAARRVMVRSVDVADTGAVVAAAQGAAMIWLESPTNPLLDVAEVRAVAAAVAGTDTLLVVDNTFATPLLQEPLALGAHVVVHSATKLLAGHSDVVLGAAVVRDVGHGARLRRHRSLHGAVPGPMEVYLALRGMRTLALRLERAQSNAGELARRLRDHPGVSRVRYPGFGAMCSIEVTGGAAAADAVVAAVRLWVHATSLGGVESTLERRRRWPAESHVVPESLLRLSVGIEDVEDLWHDLAQALDQAVGT